MQGVPGNVAAFASNHGVEILCNSHLGVIAASEQPADPICLSPLSTDTHLILVGLGSGIPLMLEIFCYATFVGMLGGCV